jgi:tetratricopeptide (TPR) repeat protein
MNLDTLHIRRFILVCLLTSGLKTYAQDTTLKFTLDTSIFSTISLGRFQPSFNYIYHSPDKKDEQRYKKYKSLIGQKPTLKNHELYYSLACSLWELEKMADAEKMFLAIIKSNDKYYSSTYYHSSDIPGDKTKNIYGYGSFTSNYKNYAAIYLTKIYLEQKRFDEALHFLEEAVNTYKVTYTCGTGFHRQQDEYEFLYAACYEGLNRHKDVINLLLPSCLDRNDEIIITALKNTYTKKEIEENLKDAEASIICSLDTFPSYAYQTSNYGTKKAKTDTIKYFSGTATITLFDRQINMPVPRLENGEQLTKEMFIKLFRESDFYIRLKGET